MSNCESRSVGVVGLGLLGTALAERLLAYGYRTVVYNRTQSKAEPLIERGAIWSDNPFQDCDRVVVCLYTTSTVRSVLGEMTTAFREGHIVIDTTTGSPTESPELGRWLDGYGVRYLESPIAASSEQTRRGEALAMVGGPKAVFGESEDILNCIAPRSFHVGDWGDAAKTKLVNNLILGLNRVALAEGLVFAKSIGLDLRATFEVLKVSNSHSVIMDLKGEKMVNRDFTPQAKLAQHGKDVRLMLEEATKAGIELPLSTCHLQLLDQAEELGFGDVDNSAVIEAVECWKSDNGKDVS